MLNNFHNVKTIKPFNLCSWETSEMLWEISTFIQWTLSNADYEQDTGIDNVENHIF